MKEKALCVSMLMILSHEKGSLSEISGGDLDIIRADEVLVKFANIAEEKVQKSLEILSPSF